MNARRDRSTPGFGEFVTLMALMSSLVALSIDAMLPALPEIGMDLGVRHANDNQLIISLLFLGTAVGHMIYGPLSDGIGRKPAVYAGFALFIIGCLFSLFATNFSIMLVGRVLQGIGVAGPRVVSIALIRDQYSGNAMARVMSFIMGIFIIVPAIAPALGQGILMVAHWRAIFGAFLVLALTALVWFALRQPESLAPERRTRHSLKSILVSVREVCGHRVAFGYTITAGFVFGAFLGYLNCAQQIFQDQYGLGTRFPLYFSALALSIGFASFVNTRLVMELGMRPLVRLSLQTLGGLSIVCFAIAYPFDGHPPLWMLMTYFLVSFFFVGLLFGNLNAIAMEPLGHIAGVGASVIGSLSMFISLPLGMLIGQSYNGTILPLVIGFGGLGTLSLLTMRWADSGAKPVPA